MSANPHRGEFLDFEGVTYLNAAFQGPLPRVAVQALEGAVHLKTHPFLLRDSDYFDFPDAYRNEAAALLGAEACDVAVTDSTVHAISTLTTGLDWRPGDEVLIPKGEFPSNRFPWLALAEKGVVVREVAPASGAAAAEAFDAAAGPRTRVVAVGWVHYSSGRRFDLAALGEVARRRGALFVVDATQGLGGLPFALAETPCDLVACSGYKWLLGPYGLGFAWFAPELQERLTVSRINWFAVKGARDFARLADCGLELEPGARRFDVNETASFFNLAAGTAALRYVRGVGAGTIAAHVAALHDRIAAGLPRGVRVVSESDPRHRSNLLCLAGPDAGFAERAFTELARREVRVSRREGAIRVSPHLYNDAADADRLLAGLAAAVTI
jgi:cysteine desulfurase / selenocysteine lyase